MFVLLCCRSFLVVLLLLSPYAYTYCADCSGMPRTISSITYQVIYFLLFVYLNPFSFFQYHTYYHTIVTNTLLTTIVTNTLLVIMMIIILLLLLIITIMMITIMPLLLSVSCVPCCAPRTKHITREWNATFCSKFSACLRIKRR